MDIKRALTCIFFLSTLLSSTTFATPSASDYGALPVTQMVAISPSGNLIAFRRVSDGRDMVTVNSLSEKKVVFMADVSKIQPQTIEFFTDDKIKLVASDFTRVKGFRGQFDLSTAYVLDIKDKKIRQLLIPGELILAGQTGLGRVVGVSPDGHYAYMPAWSDVDNQFPNSEYSLYKVDLTKRAVTPATRGGQRVKDFFIDKEGETIAIEEFDERNSLHKIRSKLNGGKWTEIFTEKTTIRKKNFVGLTPDYASLVFVESDEKTGRDTYNLMKLSDGTITNAVLSREDADIEAGLVDLHRVVQGVRFSGFSPSYKFFDAALDQRMKDLIAQFPEHSVYLTDWSPDWKHIVINVQGSNYASDYFLASENQTPVFLTAGLPQIQQADINPLGKLKVTARDGLKIPTLLTIPRSKASEIKKLPAIIYPHGGPAAHDEIGFDYFAQALASQGYLVIQPQFRGSSGFGAKFSNAGLGEWGRKMQDDITDAVKFFVDKGYIDPEKVCIVGSSYGGYAALAGGAFTPDLYKCIVSINGIGDLNAMLAHDRDTNIENSEETIYWERQLANANGDIDKKDLESRSPEKFAQQFKAKTLLISSANDKIVSPEQSENMYKALVKNNKQVEKVELEGDDHHLRKGPTRTKAVEEVVKFVNTQLK
ncbi:prolyl oligopeptidase [Cellvibrio zantedeschiae]|uniref:Prolyl oligopeptidase n=1 Tax=Cellvibrio zantedeschiae TaxID=1237077 RepID=A0ABQ3B9G2_9GAMM|nr:prolyl oligopeptidase family serine peptidase [Cellvibrio zantedeschiae]GGY81895.1 prolyl oligopeptidase [Cellvibrio zantedeschiae]